MRAIPVTSRMLEAFSADVRRGFEQRLVAFLRQHAPGFREGGGEPWRNYERSARRHGLATEQEIALYAYGCYVLGGDIDEHDEAFLVEVSEISDPHHRLVLIEERVLAYALAREMVDRP